MTKALGLTYDRIRWEEKALAAKTKAKGYDVKMVDAKSLVLNIESSTSELEDQFGSTLLQRCISHFRGLYLTAYLESKGIKVVNSFKVSEVCGNKLLTSLALVKNGVPTPKTMFAFATDAAMQAVEKIGYPAVLKPVTGSWGRLVAPLKDRDTAQAMVEFREQMDGPLGHIYYVQEMVERPPRDIRTIVVGERLVAAVYRHAPPDEWRTNIARGGKASPCPVTNELENIVLKAAKAVGEGVLGVDAMEGANGIVVHEVNSTVEFKGASSVSDEDIPGAIIDYVIECSRR